MCFPLIAGDSPVAPSWPDKALLKYRQSTVSKQSEKERECCSGNSSGMGRDLAAILQLENLTGAASEHRLGLLTLGGLSGHHLRSLSARSGIVGDFHQPLCEADKRGRALLSSCISMLLFTFSACRLFASTVSFWWGCVCVTRENSVTSNIFFFFAP